MVFFIKPNLNVLGQFKIDEFLVLFDTSILNKYRESHDNTDFRELKITC